MISPPIWLKSARLSRLWWTCGLASLLTAASESTVGLWLRRFSGDAQAQWLWILGILLLVRLALSAWRDLTGEHLALRSRSTAHAASWQAWQPAPQEHLQTIENGTRAALQLRTGLVSLALLLPTMAILAPSLALGALGCALVLGLASRHRGHALRPLTAQDLRIQSDFETQELWARRSLPEALAGGAASKVARVRASQGLHLLKQRLAIALRWQRHQSLMEVAAHAASLLLCTQAFLLWRSGSLPIGQFLAFLALALLAYRPVREAGRALPACARAEQLAIPPRMPSALPRCPQLEVEGLSFSFATEPLLEGISFALPPGTVALLHGPNGSGKTTLLRLCAGQLAATHGCIVLPEGSIHWVDQETVLPPLPLRRWTGLPSPPQTPAVARFFQTHIQPFLPDLDWNAPIPDGGSLLSRGQRIRLRLWAMACRPGTLWLLDEPLSALPRPERLPFLTALLACRQGAAVLIADQEIPDWPTAVLATPVRGPSIHRLDGA